LVLVSGGGSALVDAPVAGIGASELASITQRLLASGASIEELNAIRVGLSRSKGGGLAHQIRARAVRVIVVSDIVSGDATQVASGPMSPWRGPSPSEVATRPHVARALDETTRRILSAWRPVESVGVPLEVVADNAKAVTAAAGSLRQAGCSVEAGPPLRGEARECGRAWADAARHTRADALVAGGETVVTLRGRGRGGRSQEVALAAMAAGIPGSFLCAGTDGIDGPTDAAGACIDAAVRGAASPDAIARALDDNDSYSLLASCGGLVITGPTGTNVADLAIWSRDDSSPSLAGRA
jgi:glycerate-2-kinase